jgi:OmpA-OmpF porin, OOP family
MKQPRAGGPTFLLLSGSWALALVVASSQAVAQPTAPGFSVDRFDPAERGSDWFALDSLDLRGRLRPAVGVTLEWARKPLVLYGPDGAEQAAIVRDQLFAHVGAALVLAGRLRLGVNLPAAVHQAGETGMLDGVTYLPPDGGALGDLRLGADVRLLGQAGGPLTMALGARVHIPTGTRASYTSDGRARVAPHLAAAGDARGIAWAARAGVNLRRAYEGATAALGDELLLGAAIGWRALDGRLLVGPELLAASSFEDFTGSKASAVELLLGGHFLAPGGLRVGAGVGPGLSQGPGSPQVRFLFTLEWAAPAPPADGDGDGIPDPRDACPAVAGPRSDDPEMNGCPRPADRDRDGVPDREDACPDQPGGRSADPRSNGCPPPPPADGDKDGIPDRDDACPDKAGPASADPKANGCPPDRDKDGVPDAEDACPDLLGVTSPDPKKNGCPADRDGDGVPDLQDACPDQAGAQDPDPKKNGCPLARIDAEQIKIREQVKFRTRSAKILPESDSIIKAVADLLAKHPEIKSVRIEGHTDSDGSNAFNLQLSAARARAVLQALAAKGVERGRLKAAGFGEENPIDKNDTPQGKQNNRRVEFHLD